MAAPALSLPQRPPVKLRQGSPRPGKSDTVEAKIVNLPDTASLPSRKVAPNRPGQAAALTPGEGVMSKPTFQDVFRPKMEEWEKTGLVDGKAPAPWVVELFKGFLAENGDEGGDQGEAVEAFCKGGGVKGFALGGGVMDWLGQHTGGVVGTSPNVLATRQQNAGMNAGNNWGDPGAEPFDPAAFNADLQRYHNQSAGPNGIIGGYNQKVQALPPQTLQGVDTGAWNAKAGSGTFAGGGGGWMDRMNGTAKPAPESLPANPNAMSATPSSASYGNPTGTPALNLSTQQAADIAMGKGVRGFVKGGQVNGSLQDQLSPLQNRIPYKAGIQVDELPAYPKPTGISVSVPPRPVSTQGIQAHEGMGVEELPDYPSNAGIDVHEAQVRDPRVNVAAGYESLPQNPQAISAKQGGQPAGAPVAVRKAIGGAPLQALDLPPKPPQGFSDPRAVPRMPPVESINGPMPPVEPPPPANNYDPNLAQQAKSRFAKFAKARATGPVVNNGMGGNPAEPLPANTKVGPRVLGGAILAATVLPDVIEAGTLMANGLSASDARELTHMHNNGMVNAAQVEELAKQPGAIHGFYRKTMGIDEGERQLAQAYPWMASHPEQKTVLPASEPWQQPPEQRAQPLPGAMQMSRIQGLPNGGATVDLAGGGRSGSIASGNGAGMDRVIRGIALRGGIPPRDDGSAYNPNAPQAIQSLPAQPQAGAGGGMRQALSQTGAASLPQRVGQEELNRLAWNASVGMGQGRAKDKVLLENALEHNRHIDTMGVEGIKASAEIGKAQATGNAHVQAANIMANARTQPDAMTQQQAAHAAQINAMEDGSDKDRAIQQYHALYGGGGTQNANADYGFEEIDDPNWTPDPKNPFAVAPKIYVQTNKRTGQAARANIGQSNAGQKPTLQQFLAAARQHNPGVSDQQLIQYYGQNYGG